jgi:hypothetical protein
VEKKVRVPIWTPEDFQDIKVFFFFFFYFYFFFFFFSKTFLFRSAQDSRRLQEQEAASFTCTTSALVASESGWRSCKMRTRQKKSWQSAIARWRSCDVRMRNALQKTAPNDRSAKRKTRRQIFFLLMTIVSWF